MKYTFPVFNIVFFLAFFFANVVGMPFSYKIYGIMVCRDDHWVLRTWLQMYASSFEKLVILDGSGEEAFRLSKEESEVYSNVIHVSEKEAEKIMGVSVKKTDNGLRGLAWSFLNATEVLGNWVVIAHPDEFYPQKFVDIAKEADQQGHNVIRMPSYIAVPFKPEEKLLETGIGMGPKCFNILHRITRCAESFCCAYENRMYRYHSPDVQWGENHTLVIPQVFPNTSVGAHHGFLVHFKIHDFGDKAIDPKTGRFGHSVWSGLGSYGKGGFPDHVTGNITHYSLLDPDSDPKTWLQKASEFCSHYSVPCSLLPELERYSHRSHSCSS